MKNFSKTLIILFVLHSGLITAQSKHFITSGTIEFEKTQNMFAIMKKKVTPTHMENQSTYENYQKSEQQFLIYKSTLVFNATSSLFTPEPGKSIPWYYWAPIAEQLNTIYSDFGNQNTTVQKVFYERTYLIKDSLRKIKWKLTDETRKIAGYNCRRANGLILDSVYVVAFYTEDIHVSGGPESFNGLPGMILGVVLPHENINWYATKITVDGVDEKKLVSPKKGIPATYKEFYKVLWDTQSRYGDVGRYYIMGFYF